MAIAAVLWGVAAYFALAVLAVATSRAPGASRLIYAGCIAVSLGILGVAAGELLGGPAVPSAITLPVGLPWIGAHFRLDALAAYFLIVVNLGAAGASLYALGYGQHETAPERVLPFYPAFLAGMNLVLVAADAFSFLVAWEFMSLSSWALVVSHHREPENTRAGTIYILMAMFGTLALLLAFGLLSGPTGAYAFDEIRGARHADWLPGLVLMLMLIGAGSKAGLAPLHVWLPLAHPAAPSHVSALMSGVMTKVAIYGFIRIVFDLLGPPAWWWSIPVIGLGAATAVLGVLYATVERDLKRLLAYSTVENVGIIFVGLGLALAFKANGMAGAAALALTAALLHVLNHSFFKSLLFFGSGAVLTATGERDIERLGGLIHPMPQTAFLVLGGCLAISALPPLNGFVSEWLLFQAVLLSPNLPQWGLKLIVPAAGAMLALGAALSAACFVRAFGIAFLGRPRSPQAAAARETDPVSRAAMGLLLAACLAAGILPGFIIDAMAPVVQAQIGAHMPEQSTNAWLSIVPIAESRSSYNGLLVFLFIALSALVAAEAIHRLASRALRRAPAWDCGYPEPSPAAQYTADSFSQPIRRVFGEFAFLAREKVDMPPPGDARPARLHVSTHDLIWDGLYAPLAGAIQFAANRLNVLQFMTIRQYLSLVFVALVALLFIIAIWP
ncbi:MULTISPECIES: hydrogenase 4 subunit B [Rhodomicrobium]|uniref:hydrogenase 4 subunit B n=1 Tax=Rhodomicrobium TaxID=1068 RepID=UPI000B4A6711|nr:MULTISPECIES: hydrogenase 4 subunit B [Rhodomicrobium]